MNDQLLILTNIKKTILRLEKFLENYSRTETTLKEKMKEEMYELLKDGYTANLFKDSERILYQKKMLVHIKMLDFYLYASHTKKLISHKQYTSTAQYLLDIFILIQGWIKSEKTG